MEGAAIPLPRGEGSGRRPPGECKRARTANAHPQVCARRSRRLLGRRDRRAYRGRRARPRRIAARADRWRRSTGYRPPILNADQRPAADDLAARVAARAFSATLLEGVTGSGKTEVYFEAIAEALRQGRQALVLLPEIALTAQFLDRFAARFGARPAEWHSGLTARQRERAWRAVASGEARAVVGARSALFLPFADLGLIVVDEEHEGAYKQEDGVVYNARDMAVVRARLEAAPVVLASATPAIETRVNAETGRYRWLRLPSRFGAATMPALATVDLKREGPPRGRWLSPKAIAAIEAAFAEREQALLFLNRRGYAPLTLCRSCGHRFECPNCAAWLVEHRFRAALVCHHCGHVEPRPNLCPECHDVDSLAACGPASSGWRKRRRSSFPTRARWCCHPTFRAASRPCAGSSTPPRAANSIFSSARNSSPRVTIFRS